MGKNAKILTSVLIITLMLCSLSTALAPQAFGSSEEFVIVNVTVKSSVDTARVYPGSKGVNLKIESRYQGDSSAQSVVGWLITTTENIGFSAGSGACSPALLLNGSVATAINTYDYVTFEYLLDISSSLSPDTYNLILNITYVKYGNFTYEVHSIALTISPYPDISLRLVDAYFSPASYPGSIGTNLYVILENTGDNSIGSATFNVTLPANFTIRNQRASVGLINEGERFTLTFSDISIPLDAEIKTYEATIYADVNARTEDGIAYNSTASLTFLVNIESPPPEEPIMIATITSLYNGVPAPLLPSARGVVLRIYLINRLPETISAISLNATLPEKIQVRAISGTYISGMAPGGTCYVDLTFDINSEIDIGRYSGELNITYLKIVSGASFLMNQTISFPLDIESFNSYISELALVTAYWGYPDPAPTYSTSRYVPLTIRLFNNGRYAVWGAFVNASSPYLIPIKNSEACATTVASGGYCTTVLYFDINADSPNIPVQVYASYLFMEFGTYIPVIRSFTAFLPVESYPASESILSVVDLGWQNNLNVFPRTSNATYEITLANRAPFQIGGINLTLKLPEGLSSKGQSEASAYLDGPVRSLATFTAPFMVSVGDIPAGTYNATLTVECILLSGGPGVRRVEEFTVQVDVSDDSFALEVLDARWYDGSVGPNTYGAYLIITIRDVYVDGLKGAVLELNLPEGIYNSADNSSRVKAAPISMQLPQPLQLQDLSEIISTLLSAQQSSSAQVYGRGDVLTFMFSLNLFNVSVGNHAIEGVLSYIDSWGSYREISVPILVAVLGRTEYIEIVMDRSINIKSRYVNASLTLTNRGSSPVYDAYVVLSPFQGTPILIASPAVNYIEKIDPEEICEVPLTLAYNPIGFYYQTGGASSITYGTVPMTVSIFYRDVSGYSRVFNNTITVVVEPFIDLMVRNVKATGTNATSTLTGILVNYGSSTAYRVEVELIVGDAVGWSLIGDVDPGSEVAFRLDVSKYNESAVLTVKYYNMFNELESKGMNVSIALQEETETPSTQQEQLPIERWIIVVGVIVFLAVATVLIYKMMKKSKIPNET